MTERDERFLRHYPWYCGAVALLLLGYGIYAVVAEGTLFGLAVLSLTPLMGYSSLIARAVGDVIRRGVAERGGAKPAFDRDDVSPSNGFDSDRIFRFTPLMTGATAVMLLSVAVASATQDGGSGLAAYCFFSATVFILLTLLTGWAASRTAARRRIL